MKKIMITIGFLIATTASSTKADIDAVRSCEATLAPTAKLILQTVMPKLTPEEDARKVFKETVISMIQSGQIESSDARKSAQEAAGCLKKFNN